MKTILGLDLGTNSIGWALVQQDEKNKTGKIIAANSRIIPMDQGILGDFDKGNSISQTAERTSYRGVRRLHERALLRRERLHRVLHIMKFLPSHYESNIDFELHLGQFINHTEPKIDIVEIDGKYNPLFRSSFNEMLNDFSIHCPELVKEGKKVPYGWTIYFLRKKALTQKIEKEELAWILLNFNHKRGYYQLRGEDEEENNDGKSVEFYSLKVVDVIDSGDRKGSDIWYNVILENGWVYRRSSKVYLDWVGKIKDFIVTTDIDEEGNIKKDKYGNEKRSLRAPGNDDWTLIKKKTEKDIEKSHKTVGCYIYDSLLSNPEQKIKGKLVRTIERKYYKEELIRILEKQKEFHPELRDKALYNACVEELYPHNENHRESIKNRDFTYLFVNDIIFYQRPLKSKKSLIASCRYETRSYKDKDGHLVSEPIKCIPKSHPLYQEFRLWQFVQNLRIYKKEMEVEGQLCTDVLITDKLLPTEQDWVDLFDWLNEKEKIDQKTFLKYPKFGLKGKIDEYRWNYVEDKFYPCNETHALISNRLAKAGIENLSKDDEESLWHILYSVEDRSVLIQALNSFADKKELPESLVEVFKKFPPFEKEYGAYSAKAIKRLLPLMRIGKYWSKDAIDIKTQDRINKLIDGEWDGKISDRVREKSIQLRNIDDFKGLPHWLACYVIYNRYSEGGDVLRWETPADMEHYLKHEFKQYSLKNPIVEQVILETLRVVNDVWKYYGEGRQGFFDEIHIELGRKMKISNDDKKRLALDNLENENTNLRIRTILMELKEEESVENIRPYSPNQLEAFKIFEEDILKSGIEIPEEILKISKSAQPSKSEVLKYRLWLEQKYCSPYTGKVIPLSKLFTSAYEIEHVIPQARYFDDSLSNKVICESAVNKDKGSKLGYEYIKNNGGQKIELGLGQEVNLLSIEEYEDFIRSRYSANRAKMRKLLLDDIPDSFIARQLNDSRYISRMVQGLLSAVVRKEDERELVSKNIVSCNGAITTRLKQDWGLNDVWNGIITPRFERLNQLTGSNQFGEWTNKDGKRVFQAQVPLYLQKGFKKKRIDHRHHLLDAIIISCATRNHINYLNNKYAKTENERNDLKLLLCDKYYVDDKGNYRWIFKKPWDSFTQETREVLLSAIVSFKQNLRVINKTVNLYQKWEIGEDGISRKVLKRQEKGDSWAIRKPLHKETIYGRVSLRIKKQVSLSVALNNWISLVDKRLKSEIKQLIKSYGKFDKNIILKYFKDRRYLLGDRDISKVEIYVLDDKNAVSRVGLDTSFDSKKIDSITDTGIQKILKKHLALYNENDGKIIKEHPELAFSADGIDELNKNIIQLNDGKYHKSIYKVRLCEPIGNKFVVGYNGSKKDKYVEAAKGTNLFFAIYEDGEGKRSYESIPLNVIIERQKLGLDSVPEINDKGYNLLFSLSPNDLVYVPTLEEQESGCINWGDKKKIAERVYKMVSCTGCQCFFIPEHVASPIMQTKELGANNKAERAWGGEMIKECAVKIHVDRLGRFK